MQPNANVSETCSVCAKCSVLNWCVHNTLCRTVSAFSLIRSAPSHCSTMLNLVLDYSHLNNKYIHSHFNNEYNHSHVNVRYTHSHFTITHSQYILGTITPTSPLRAHSVNSRYTHSLLTLGIFLLIWRVQPQETQCQLDAGLHFNNLKHSRMT